MDDRLSEQTLSHTSRRGLSCCISWLRLSTARFFFSFSPSGEAPQGCQQPSHFTTEQNEATQRFTMWPDLAGPSLGGLNLPSTFMVAKHDWGGRGIWEKENWGNWRKGVCGGVVEMKRFLHITQVGIISKNSTGLCDFPPHFFINQGKKF